MFFTLFDYYKIIIFLMISIAISLIVFNISYLFSDRYSDSEKVSPYECGFDPFDDARHTFDVRFYLVAILFVLFDLEITFLIPWAISLANIGLFGYWSMFFFLLILTIGFIYEWNKGALEWS